MALDLKRREMIEEVLEVLGSGKRLAALEQITQGVAGKDIHKQIDASRSGVQHFLNDFKEAGLVQSENGVYELTDKGEVVVDTLSQMDSEFEQFEIETFMGFAQSSSLSIEQMEEMLEQVKQQKEN
jgi:predicted transcriptional regulator